MTEKDQMLAGKAYLGSEEQLVKERQYAKQVLFKFNNMNPVLVEERHNLLRELLGQTKENFYFEPPFRCDYGYNIEIGNRITRLLGSISYEIYLSHVWVMSALVHYFPDLSSGEFIILTYFITILLSMAVHKVVIHLRPFFMKKAEV